MTDSKNSLKSQLDSYSETVTALEANRSWKDRVATWSAYAAVTGSALALSTNANAGIIYSGIQNVTVSVPETPGTHSDFKTFAIDPLLKPGVLFGIGIANYVSSTYRLAYAGFGFVTGTASSIYGGVRVNCCGSVLRMFFSSFVGATSSSFIEGGPLRFRYASSGSFNTSYGDFQVGKTGFAGIYFSTAADGPFFGWMRLRLDDTNNDTWFDTLTAIDWAYNDVAGADIHVVPEPSTAAMAILAAGAAGIVAWRKRRNASKAIPAGVTS